MSHKWAMYHPCRHLAIIITVICPFFKAVFPCLGITHSCCCCCVQVLLPVYDSNVLVAMVLHKRSAVLGRCVFKIYGLMPLLIKEHIKSLTLYR